MKASEALEYIRQAVRDAGGLPDAAVFYADAAQPYAAGPVVRLGIPAWIDETNVRVMQTAAPPRPPEPANPDRVETTLSRLVVFTISLQVETLGHTRAGDGLDVATAVSAGLSFPEVRAALIAAGVVPVRGPSDAQPVSVIVDDRVLDVVVFDWQCRAELHETRYETAYVIEHMQATGTIAPDNISVSIEADKP